MIETETEMRTNTEKLDTKVECHADIHIVFAGRQIGRQNGRQSDRAGRVAARDQWWWAGSQT